MEQLRFIFNTAKIFRKYWKSAQIVIAQISHLFTMYKLNAGIEAEPEDATPLTYWANRRDYFDALGPIFSLASYQLPPVPD